MDWAHPFCESRRRQLGVILNANSCCRSSLCLHGMEGCIEHESTSMNALLDLDPKHTTSRTLRPQSRCHPSINPVHGALYAMETFSQLVSNGTVPVNVPRRFTAGIGAYRRKRTKTLSIRSAVFLIILKGFYAFLVFSDTFEIYRSGVGLRSNHHRLSSA